MKEIGITTTLDGGSVRNIWIIDWYDGRPYSDHCEHVQPTHSSVIRLRKYLNYHKHRYVETVIVSKRYNTRTYTYKPKP